MAVDLLLRRGRVHTVDPDVPRAEAIGVVGGRIAWVGADTDVPAARRTIDLGGRLVLPGFIDSHNHVRLGSNLDAVQLAGIETLEGVRAAIDGFAVAHPERDWIVAEGWSYAALPERRRPRAADLDGVVPGRAILVVSYDAHVVWLNREAMRRIGIDRQVEMLPFGRVEHDPDGEPTGYIADFAVMGLSREGIAALAAISPADFGAEAQYRSLRSSLDLAISSGITTIVEPQNSLDDLALFKRARADGILHSRLIAALFHPPETSAADLDAFAEARRRLADDRLRVGPLKLYIDDVVEPHTAALLEPYADEPSTSGASYYEPDEFASLVVDLEERGFQLFVHATGDRGVRTVLDGVEHARAVRGPADARHQVVHAELIHPDDVPRFGRLGVVACMQPRHAAPDVVTDWRPAVGPARYGRAFPWRALVEADARLAFSSDWNVTEMEPLIGLQAAVTRADRAGRNAWTVDQAVDLATAIHAYTMGGAYANFLEADRGSISVGKQADLIALSENLFTIAPADYPEVGIDLVMVDGEAVVDRV